MGFSTKAGLSWLRAPNHIQTRRPFFRFKRKETHNSWGFNITWILVSKKYQKIEVAILFFLCFIETKTSSKSMR